MRYVMVLLVAAALSPVTHVLRPRPTTRAAAAAKDIRAVQRVSADVIADANDNRTPAGTRVGDTLELRLTVSPVLWQISGDSNPGFKVVAFAEEGRTPSIPGPLLRVRVGTPIHAFIRNPLDDTLVVRGLSEGANAHDSLVVLPRTAAEVRFVARREGTYQYWGALTASQRDLLPANRGDEGLFRSMFDSQLAGAFIVDPSGPVAKDRILVITEFSHQTRPIRRDRHGVPGREFTALNGRSWPYTERLRHTTIRWRIINTSFQAHPMHLHGFYFRVDSHGNALTGVDSIYTPAQRRMAVTEVIGVGQNATIVWSPDQPGGWIFHCHLTNHAVKTPALDQQSAIEFPDAHDHSDPDNHVITGMSGLILGVTVAGPIVPQKAWRPAKRLRLVVQSDSVSGDSTRRFGYVLQRGAEPRRDSVENPGPVLLLTRGEATSIEVVNRSTEPTSVHWHGIELESRYDGAIGWSGTAGRLAPAIRPDSSFEVRITPKRAGTFMYHTHFNEIRQQYGGLVGALVVLEPGQRWDPTRDLLFLLSEAQDGSLMINGSAATHERVLRVGTTYRIRIADITVYRQNMWARVMRDSSLASWRPVAKDGFALTRAHAVVRPSVAQVASGETADFELTPERPGEARLEFGPIISRTGDLRQIQGTVRLRILAP